MNTELLLKVKDAILAEPARINMAAWVRSDHSVPCGTVGCIYGWGQALLQNLRGSALREYVDDVNIEDAGIGNNPFALDYDQTQRLYYTKGWPTDLRIRLYELPPQTPRYAKVVADRIDRFIATNGEE